MLQIDSVDKKKQRTLAIVWSVTFLIVFPLLITLGLLMRLNQGELIELHPDTFYALMTLHGLGMAGLLFSMAFAALWYLISTRYVKLNVAVGYFVFITIIIGVLALAWATLIGKFGAGWYLLYPLPFRGTWTTLSTQISIISILIMGVGWLVGILHFIYALAKEYGGFINLLGWQYLRKKKEERELPPIIMISTISLIPGVFAFLAGAVMLAMYLLQSFETSLEFDPLLMKNLTFFFGHTLVNITLYCGVGWVYTLLPEYTGRPWGTNKVLVYSWNATFLFILFAYFHHLYMDFNQPSSFQVIGQIVSFSSAIPATAITMFGIIVQFYHSKMKWSIVPTMFLIGMSGWAIGGFSAVIDSTIVINKVFHNTLWVPAHFHTYMLLGIVLFILAFLFYFFSEKNPTETGKLSKAGFWLFVIGGFSFVLMFYLGGMESIPRRFSNYALIDIEHTHQTGAYLARIAAYSIYVLLLGLFLMYISLFTKLFKSKAKIVES